MSHYVCYVHPDNERVIRRFIAWQAGSPIQRHGRSRSARGRKRELLRSWHPR